LGVEQKPAQRRGKITRGRVTPPSRAKGRKKAYQSGFFACVEQGISGKNSLVRLEVIGGIKIVIDAATQL
jgi:hypothetical protein